MPATATAHVRAMARWTLAGALGDAVGPVLLALMFGWRGVALLLMQPIGILALLLAQRVRARPS